MPPITRAEATHYAETSLHADVMAFLAALDARGDARLHLTSFGASPEGRELPLVVASAHGVRTPAEARAKGLPVVLVINGIHAGEVEGKEACQMLLRDLLDGSYADGAGDAPVAAPRRAGVGARPDDRHARDQRLGAPLRR